MFWPGRCGYREATGREHGLTRNLRTHRAVPPRDLGRTSSALQDIVRSIARPVLTRSLMIRRVEFIRPLYPPSPNKRLPRNQACGLLRMVFIRSAGVMWPTTLLALPGCGRLRMLPLQSRAAAQPLPNKFGHTRHRKAHSFGLTRSLMNSVGSNLFDRSTHHHSARGCQGIRRAACYEWSSSDRPG